MGFRDWGNPPAYSTTAATTTDPSTAALVAELQATQDDLYEVRFVVGASTGAIWRLEHANSTSLASGGIRQQTVVFTGSNQSAEFILSYKAEAGDIFRIVPLSSFTGTAAGKIQAEIIT